MNINFLQFLKQNPEKPLGGRYEVTQQLGVGGFGQTFLAKDLHLPGQPLCVLKQLKPQVRDTKSLEVARRLFDTEAQVLYQLGNHDQIPRLLAHFEDNQEFYLAQELIEGKPLRLELVSQHAWPESKVVALLRDILQTLAFVHDQNVIHRDINPSNLIRRDRDGKIVLIDFGAVKQASTQLVNPESSVTQTVAIGTMGYMPNEQIAGNPRFSSDLYAVGMIGIQALTGISPRQLPQDPRTGELAWHSHASEVSPELQAVLDRMVRYDFRDRYVTAREALKDLEAVPVPAIPGGLVNSDVFDAEDDLNSAADTLQLSPAAKQAETEVSTPPPNEAAPNAVVPPPAAQPAKATEATLALAPPSGARSFSPQSIRNIRPIAFGVLAVGVGLILFRSWIFPASPPQGTENPAQANSGSETAQPAPDLLSQANTLRESGQYQAALEQYDQILAEDAQVVEAHWGKCFSLNQLQQHEAAVVACDRALEIDPNHAMANWSKGYALEQQKRYQEALTAYDRTLQLQPDFSQAWSNKCTVLVLTKQPQDALTACDRAIALDANLEEAWNSRGAALWSLRRFDEAIASVDKAIALKPDYQDALNLRQEMQRQRGQ